ncbi:MAG: VanZ family protein [Candidatus Omnitrophica bacterium]|nr:VanZ family protein [Candidatus Omnitrophota bacterium]
MLKKTVIDAAMVGIIAQIIKNNIGQGLRIFLKKQNTKFAISTLKDETFSDARGYSSLRSQVALWLPVLAYAAFIFYLSSLSDTGSLIEFPFLDKILHTLEYSILGFLFMRAFSNFKPKFKIEDAFAFSVIFSFLYAISDEIHQIFVVARSASLPDAIFDLIGASLGAYFYYRRISYDRYKSI